MRCEDLTRELASPTGALTEAEMAGHLAACPSCAAWSRRADHFDRIWEATRPVEPSADVLDALWARASAELDAPGTLRIVPTDRPRRLRRLAVFAFVAAQAAAVLVAALVLMRQGDGHRVEVAKADPRPSPTVQPPHPLDLHVGADGSDQLAVVHIGKDNRYRFELHDLSAQFASSALPDLTPHDEVSAVEAVDASWGTVASTIQ
jgi:hypothetical protein